MPEQNRCEIWVKEKHKDFYAMAFRVVQTLFSGTSPFQQVDVVETKGHGRMLLNDGLVMISERDEFVYHEMISHVPLFVHPNPERVLVIGGGDGGTVREVLKHRSVKECILVEIDAMVIDACRKHLPSTASALDDPRAKVEVGDGVAFVAERSDKFDVVIIDSTDPIGPAVPLFGEEFFTNVKKILNEKGIVVAQGESPFYEIETQISMLKILSGLFEPVHIYNCSNLTYPGGLWSFAWGSKGLCPIRDFEAGRVEKRAAEFSYYNAGIHGAAFCLPQFMKKKLNEFLTPLPGEE